MYRALLYVPVIALSFLLAACSSCGGGKKKDSRTNMNGENPMVEELDETPDSAFLARLVEIKDDSIRVISQNSGKRLAYACKDAQAAGKVKGTLEKGNIFSIYPDNKSRQVIAMINTTELSGKWIYDQKQRRGFSFNERGGMSSINAEKICFREWKLLNGLLYLYYVEMQQSADNRHKYGVDEANIASLSKERLTLQFKDMTLRCSRPSDKPLKFK